MAVQKPSIPRGMRDFGPDEMFRRNYIFNTIRSVFQLYGYQPLETPTMENLSTLMGKYGEEGDKLLFKVLNSGNYIEKVNGDYFSDYKKLTSIISEKGLRYDLTVPFARYVVMNRNELTFPFKRYQIQPVWRADKPQKGRYREFCQCDVDVIGSKSLLNEIELLQIINEVFDRLKIDITIKINNRKILTGLAQFYKIEDNKIIEFITILDKLEKMGIDKVTEELIIKGFDNYQITKIKSLIENLNTSDSVFKTLSNSVVFNEIGQKGIEELQQIEKFNIKNVEFDLTLARGLNYYTGAIFEVKAKDVQIGSICGGGRYDDLTGIFGMPDVSGVGISFGADRIYDVMTELNLFPENINVSTQVLFINFGDSEVKYCFSIADTLRKNGITCEIFPDAGKLKKQFGYADARKIPFVIIAGEAEITQNILKIKNMNTGVETLMGKNELTSYFIDNK